MDEERRFVLRVLIKCMQTLLDIKCDYTVRVQIV